MEKKPNLFPSFRSLDEWSVCETKVTVIFQSLNRVWLFCEPMDCNRPDLSVLHYLLEFAQFMYIRSVMLFNHLILCHPLLLLPSIFPRFRVFSNESALYIRWPEYIGASVSASVLEMNIQGWFPLGLTGLISLLSKGLSRVFSSTVYIQVTAYKAKSDERKAKYLWGDFMYNYVQQGNSILSLSRLP